MDQTAFNNLKPGDHVLIWDAECREPISLGTITGFLPNDHSLFPRIEVTSITDAIPKYILSKNETLWLTYKELSIPTEDEVIDWMLKYG